MSVDELRSGFARLAEGVVPAPDPYARLLVRARRRRRAMGAVWGAFLAALLGGIVAGAPALTAGMFPNRNGLDGYEITSEWTWRLLASPTRGSLSGNGAFLADVRRSFAGKGPESLTELAVLFAHEERNTRIVAVAYHSADRGVVEVRAGRVGTPARELAEGDLYRTEPVPFLVFSDHRSLPEGQHFDHLTVGLAPVGCRVSTSDTVDQPDSTPRGYEGYAVRAGLSVAETWTVVCDDVVRHDAPVDRVDEISVEPVDTSVPGTIDPDVAAAAVGSFIRLTTAAGMTGYEPKVLWGGSIPGDRDTGPVVLVGPATGTGPLVLQRGSSQKAMVALAPDGGFGPADEETKAASRAEWSVVATGWVTRDLYAVRVPERAGGRAVLTDRVLVVTRPDLSEAGAYRDADQDGRQEQIVSVPLAGGVGVLTVPFDRAETHLIASSADGKLSSQTGLYDPGTGPRLFADELISNW